MAGATVAPLARFPLFISMGYPAVLAGGLTLGIQPGYMSYLPYPDGWTDTTWQGNLFGLSAPDGANVTNIAVTVTYRVSAISAYDLILAQVYAGGDPVGTPASFTPSSTPATGTVTVTTELPRRPEHSRRPGHVPLGPGRDCVRLRGVRRGKLLLRRCHRGFQRCGHHLGPGPHGDRRHAAESCPGSRRDSHARTSRPLSGR